MAKTGAKMNRALDVLLSSPYVGSLAPDHLADLRRSGLWDETIRLHRLRSVPVRIVPQLLGFNRAAIRSAMLLPFPHPRSGVMNHVRLKVFPPFTSAPGVTQLGLPAVGFGGSAGLTVGGHVSHAMPASAPTRRPRPKWTGTTHDQRHAPLALERDIVTVRGRGGPIRPEGSP